jgi:hypothetical protein
MVMDSLSHRTLLPAFKNCPERDHGPPLLIIREYVKIYNFDVQINLDPYSITVKLYTLPFRPAFGVMHKPY